MAILRLSGGVEREIPDDVHIQLEPYGIRYALSGEVHIIPWTALDEVVEPHVEPMVAV